MSCRESVLRYVFISILLLFIFSSFNMEVIGRNLNFQFNQLDPFYQNSLFGVKFDYNSEISSEESIQLHTDLIADQEYSGQVDPDPNRDNNITLIGHDSHEIKSAFLAIENIKRIESITLFGTIEWQASLPYFKHLLVFDIPSGESVILTQDLLGLALRLNGQNFVNNQYLVGYANIPLFFLEFLFDSLQSGQMIQNSIDGHTTTVDIPTFFSTIPMEVEIKENNNELIITTTYSNITYLFQTDAINIEWISNLNKQISDIFLLIEFESISYTTRIMKYSTSTNSGVETQLETNIGAIQNLIITEELPPGLNWYESTEKRIEKEYNELLGINKTISWYKGDDIDQRMALFDQTSLSLLFSHNLGVIEGSVSKKSSSVIIDGVNTSNQDLIQNDIVVEDNISITQKEDILFINQIKGHDYALQQDPTTQQWSLTSANIKSIALNQHPSLSGNILFLEEGSILNSLIVDSVQRFVSDMSTSALSADQLLKIATLYLTSAEYIQEFQIDTWVGYPTKISMLSTAILDSNNLEIGLSKISNFPFVTGFLSIALLVVFHKRERAK